MNHGYMKSMLESGKKEPLSFHHNWNENKLIKRKFLEQMGDWYVVDACSSSSHIMNVTSSIRNSARSDTPDLLASNCCSATPLIRCHYKDKPSVVPCRQSPSFRNGATSFW